MDELFGLAAQALADAAKAKREQQGGRQDRYRRVLEELQARAAQAPAPVTAPPAAPPAPAQAAAPPRPQPPPRAPAQTAHDREELAALKKRGSGIEGLFEDGNSLLRAVVASEVLSAPLALRENPNWLKPRRPPNER